MRTSGVNDAVPPEAVENWMSKGIRGRGLKGSEVDIARFVGRCVGDRDSHGDDGVWCCEMNVGEWTQSDHQGASTKFHRLEGTASDDYHSSKVL